MLITMETGASGGGAEKYGYALHTVYSGASYHVFSSNDREWTDYTTQAAGTIYEDDNIKIYLSNYTQGNLVVTMKKAGKYCDSNRTVTDKTAGSTINITYTSIYKGVSFLFE